MPWSNCRHALKSFLENIITAPPWTQRTSWVSQNNSGFLRINAKLVLSHAVSLTHSSGVMGMFMNGLVVEMVSGGKAALTRHMSDVALSGFCHLHHLLLALALEGNAAILEAGSDGLMRQALADIRTFIDDPECRLKRSCPDLGRLLVSLLLVPEEEVPWSEFAPVFIRELLARQVGQKCETDE